MVKIVNNFGTLWWCFKLVFPNVLKTMNGYGWIWIWIWIWLWINFLPSLLHRINLSPFSMHLYSESFLSRIYLYRAFSSLSTLFTYLCRALFLIYNYAMRAPSLIYNYRDYVDCIKSYVDCIEFWHYIRGSFLNIWWVNLIHQNM